MQQLNLQNYDAYSSNFFQVKPEELKGTLYIKRVTDEKKESVLTYFNKFLKAKKLVRFEHVPLPRHMKRNATDGSQLVFVHTDEGEIFAKRHNNSQYIRL